MVLFTREMKSYDFKINSSELLICTFFIALPWSLYKVEESLIPYIITFLIFQEVRCIQTNVAVLPAAVHLAMLEPPVGVTGYQFPMLVTAVFENLVFLPTRRRCNGVETCTVTGLCTSGRRVAISTIVLILLTCLLKFLNFSFPHPYIWDDPYVVP